ncbi:MAG TPA: CRISPR-associated endonuclease Cas2 [Rhodocyclaceae bacterium]|nr:CRISPR-associated endonuclease Cas2 [Rhodocyclaceae bacterium]
MDGDCEFTVVCFDIADDRRRRRAVRVLEAYGHRAQESVFEAWLDRRQRRQMEALLAQAVKRSEDRVAIYVLPPADRADIMSVGRGLPAEDFRHAVL